MFSQGYWIDTQICIAALWLFYIAVLHRRTDLKAARLYLLMMIPVAMLLPLLRIPLLPAVPMQEQLILTTAMPVVQIDTRPQPAPILSLFQILTWVYYAGAIAVGLLTVRNLVRIWHRVRKASAQLIGTDRVVFSPEVAGAYSVFGTIFVNGKYEGSPMLGQILAHERSHIVRRHSLDLVWMSLWRSLLWFNPFVWHIFKLLREVHEYQADRDVVRQGTAVGPYVDLLICTEAGIYPGTANALCYSLTKKRLKMITRATRSMSVGGYLRLVALLPLTGLLLGAFSLTARASDAATPQPQPLETAAPADTLTQYSVSITRNVDSLGLPTASSRQVRYIDLDIQSDTTVKISSTAKPDPGTSDSSSVNRKYAVRIVTLEELKANGISAFSDGGQNTPGLALTKGRLVFQPWPKGKKNTTVSHYENGEAIVYLSAQEQAEGITLASKLLNDCPEQFYLDTEKQWIRNRQPVKIIVYWQKMDAQTLPIPDKSSQAVNDSTITIRASSLSEAIEKHPELFIRNEDGSIINKVGVSIVTP